MSSQKIAGEANHQTERESKKRRILLTSDVRSWAFDQNLKDLAQYLSRDFDFTFWYVEDAQPTRSSLVDQTPYDGVYIPYHRWAELRTLDWSKAYGGLRSRWLWPENPRAPNDEDLALVNKFRAFHVVTQELYDEWKRAGDCPNLHYLTNPVNTRRFQLPLLTSDVVACWTGNARHTNPAGQDVKGFYPIVVPACQEAEVPLRVAEYHESRIAPSQIPEFLRHATVTVSASLYEGSSNSIEEGMAAGHAAILTDVGNHREMRDRQLEDYGETGIWLVKRDVRAMAHALSELKKEPDRVRRMGEVNRRSILEHWSWDVWAPKYAEFFRIGVENADEVDRTNHSDPQARVAKVARHRRPRLRAGARNPRKTPPRR